MATYATTEEKASNADLTFPTAHNCDVAPRELGICPCPVTARPDRGKATLGVVSGLIEEAHVDGDAILNVVNAREEVVSSAADGNMPITSTLASGCEGCQGKRDLGDSLWLDKAPRVQPRTGGPVRLDALLVGWIQGRQYAWAQPSCDQRVTLYFEG